MNGGMTMDIKQGIQDVLYLIITGVLPLLITYGILFLKVKIKEQEKEPGERPARKIYRRCH